MTDRVTSNDNHLCTRWRGGVVERYGIFGLLSGSLVFRHFFFHLLLFCPYIDRSIATHAFIWCGMDGNDDDGDTRKSR